MENKEAKDEQPPKSVEELELACDMIVIEYFEAELEWQRLKDRVNVLEKIILPNLTKRFQEAKVAHLRAKHAVTGPVRTGDSISYAE